MKEYKPVFLFHYCHPVHFIIRIEAKASNEIPAEAVDSSCEAVLGLTLV